MLQLQQNLKAAQIQALKSKKELSSLQSRRGVPGDDDKEQQSMLRESLAHTIVDNPDVGWDDVAGLEFAKKSLRESVITPLHHPQLFPGNRKPFKSILLYGPPGTGE